MPAFLKIIIGACVVLLSGLVNNIIKEANRSNPKSKSGVEYCHLVEVQLRNTAQKALDAIGSKRKLFASKERANRGQHVFNNGLLGFHRSVLQELLRDVGGYDEQLNNLEKDLISPLSQTQQDAISTWVASFSSGEFYVDFNADVYGEFVRQLRKALVKYLKADTSVNEGGRYGIQELGRRVRIITSEMVNREVYVDPMARDRWLRDNPGHVQEYNQVRDAVRVMFQNILQDFKTVSDKIRVFRRRNNWTWDRQ